jgi:hypothetical protein
MKDTWAARDLPVLDTTVTLLEDTPLPEVADITGRAGLNVAETARALQESHEAAAATADELDRAVKRAGGTSSPGSAEPPAAQPLPAVKVR